jgi:hypothetical protein
MEHPALIAHRRSHAVERARFLVAASALIIASHLVDLIEAHGPNWRRWACAQPGRWCC